MTVVFCAPRALRLEVDSGDDAASHLHGTIVLKRYIYCCLDAARWCLGCHAAERAGAAERLCLFGFY